MAQGEAGEKPKAGFLDPLGDQARVLSAFVRAFGVAIGKGLRGAKPLKVQVAAQISAMPAGTSRLWGRNARLVIEPGIAMLIDELQADVEVLDPLAPLIPEQPTGYVFKIRRGRLAMDGESIGTLMARYAFKAVPGATPPLTELGITLTPGELVLRATFHLNRLVALPFQLVGRVQVTPDGLIELVPTSIRAGALPVDRLMGMLGLELARFMPKGSTAMSFRGDRIYIDPLGLFPAPRATGRLKDVTVALGQLVMSYDDGSEALAPPLVEPTADSYMAMVGHNLLVGKITMNDVSLQLVPLDPAAGWVEFSLPHYRRQLAQGESHLNYADQLLYRLPSVAALRAGATGDLPGRA